MTTPNNKPEKRVGDQSPMVERIVREFKNLPKLTKKIGGVNGYYEEEFRKVGVDWLRTTLLRFKEEVEGEIRASKSQQMEATKLQGRFLHDGDIYTPHDVNATIDKCKEIISSK